MAVFPSLTFKRRAEPVIYYFHFYEIMNGMPSWKREDAELWITYLRDYGWACIDKERTIVGIPWALANNQKNALPPEGEWISKKGSKSYVYDLAYLK